jgi:hypothetical protein
MQTFPLASRPLRMRPQRTLDSGACRLTILGTHARQPVESHECSQEERKGHFPTPSMELVRAKRRHNHCLRMLRACLTISMPCLSIELISRGASGQHYANSTGLVGLCKRNRGRNHTCSTRLSGDERVGMAHMHRIQVPVKSLRRR